VNNWREYFTDLMGLHPSLDDESPGHRKGVLLIYVVMALGVLVFVFEKIK
jgi:hypothetical protein